MKKARISETPRVMLKARVNELKRLNLYVFVSSSVDFFGSQPCGVFHYRHISSVDPHVTCNM